MSLESVAAPTNQQPIDAGFEFLLGKDDLSPAQREILGERAMLFMTQTGTNVIDLILRYGPKPDEHIIRSEIGWSMQNYLRNSRAYVSKYRQVVRGLQSGRDPNNLNEDIHGYKTQGNPLCFMSDAHEVVPDEARLPEIRIRALSLLESSSLPLGAKAILVQYHGLHSPQIPMRQIDRQYGLPNSNRLLPKLGRILHRAIPSAARQSILSDAENTNLLLIRLAAVKLYPVDLWEPKAALKLDSIDLLRATSQVRLAGVALSRPAGGNCRNEKVGALDSTGNLQNVGKLVCASCPFKLECLATGLAASDGRILTGVWGGTTERERNGFAAVYPTIAKKLGIRRTHRHHPRSAQA